MNAGRFSDRSGHDTSTPSLWPSSAAAPVLVACPIPLAMGLAGMPAVVGEIYRLAYERAMASARPSPYERARYCCVN